jgi:hypothetical protein
MYIYMLNGQIYSTYDNVIVNCKDNALCALDAGDNEGNGIVASTLDKGIEDLASDTIRDEMSSY